MRITTYNIWNAKRNWSKRLAAIVEELAALDADVVALQEVPVEAAPGLPIDRYFREHTSYPHVLHLPYPGPADKREWPEGLAFLSKLPIENVRINWADDQPTDNSWAARILVCQADSSLSITNVHLDWRHAASRERHIVRIVRDLIDARPCDVDLLCGDLNDDSDAPVLQFLDGRASLDGYRTRWRDLAAEWHAARGESPPVTLDFEHNPRWKSMTIANPSKRVDRIYLRTAEPASPPNTLRVGLFGKHPTNRLGIIPSDHYGLFVDLDVPLTSVTLAPPLPCEGEGVGG
ncbi:MAG TPA: endonuclease/exonuclease/phosphatase family protein [Chloroflexota bacterium]|nr:endonuclease/exonuclease/phosphatase family protein [Chloroflexota bacterium]